ncbi:MAG: MCP four helix bundle domain-containing protein, partial [Sporomusaceae bacterium]|nr:MCP four helix bundle domain-containing protein [Sporomusaceae bacterium]
MECWSFASQKMKIGAKIATGFLVVVLLMAVSGGISWYLLQQIRHSSDDLQDDTLPRLLQTNHAALLGARQITALRGYVITNDEKYIQEFKGLNNDSDAIVKELEAQARTPRGKQYAQEIMTLSDQYEKLITEKLVPLQKAGKKEEVIALMNTELAPAANKLSDKYQEYIKFREQQINKIFDDSQAQMEQAKMIILIFLIIAFISSILIAVVITRKVAGPIKLAVQDLNTISSGDYSVTIPEAFLRGKDEVADMARAMDQMVQSMRTMLRKISASADHVASSSEELTASAEQSATAA